MNGTDGKEHDQSSEHTERNEAPLLAEADSNSEQECLVSNEPQISSSNRECCVKSEDPTNVPDKPNELDISGLELLYKSIEHMESLETKGALKEEVTVPDKFSADVSHPELRGLGLLCALAEQRILEEINSESESFKVTFQEPEVNNSSKPSSDLNRYYRTPQSEQEVRRYLANRKDPSQSNLTAVSVKLTPQNELEMNMRTRLAELQRKYKETQRELSRLTPRKNSTEGNLFIYLSENTEEFLHIYDVSFLFHFYFQEKVVVAAIMGVPM